MRSLLDVNVLIALLDASHAFHRRAHAWWAANARHGWASCPLVENGVARIMCHPAYSTQRQFAVEEIVGALAQFVAASDHKFWPDTLSLRDGDVFVVDHIHSGKKITDLYLLALATAHKARLVTFDQGITISAVKLASSRNLCVL